MYHSSLDLPYIVPHCRTFFLIIRKLYYSFSPGNVGYHLNIIFLWNQNFSSAFGDHGHIGKAWHLHPSAYDSHANLDHLHRNAAYKASAYLEQLVKQNAIITEESPELDKLYVDYAAPIDATSPSATKPLSDADPETSSTSATPTASPVSESESCDPTSEKAAEAPWRLLLSR